MSPRCPTVGGPRRQHRLAAGLLGALAGWTTLAPTLAADAAVPFATVARGAQSGIREPLHAVVRTLDDWTTLWRRHLGGAPPPIDFAAEMVVAVFAGTRPTGGYTVEIIDVVLAERALRVGYRERTPPPGALVTQALTAPFHIIRLPRSDLPVAVVPAAR